MSELLRTIQSAPQGELEELAREAKQVLARQRQTFLRHSAYREVFDPEDFGIDDRELANALRRAAGLVSNVGHLRR